MTATISTTYEQDAKCVCSFLSEYASLLFSCGATCIRLEKNVSRIAVKMGMKTDIAIMPRHIHLMVTDPACSDTFTSVTTIRPHPVSYEIITRLSRLSWEIADGDKSLDDARDYFQKIADTPPANPDAVLTLASLANAAFCRLFGGDAIAMLTVFIATFAGFYLKQVMTKRKIDIRLTVVACSFVSAVLASADSLFNLGTTPGIAIGTSVLYLVPGIVFINSFCDMLDGHYICAISRFFDATILTCCLSAGLCAGMMLMRTGMF